MAGIFTLANLFIAEEAPLLVRDMLYNQLWGYLPETRKSSADLDMGGIPT